MPGHKGHLIFSGVIWAIILAYMIGSNNENIYLFVIWTPLYFIGSLLPDLDSHTSKIRKWFHMVVLMLIGVFIFAGYYVNDWWYAIYAAFGAWLLLTLYSTKHRGALHSFSVALILGVLLYITLNPASAALFAGYMTHLIADKIFKNE